MKMGSTSLGGFPNTIWDRFYELEIFQRGPVYYYLRQTGNEGEVGILDLITTGILKSFLEWPQITHTAVLDASTLPKRLKGKDQHVVVDISINLSGPSYMIDDVGTALTRANGFLQHPCFLSAAIPHINPHYYYPKGVKTDLTHLIGPLMNDTETSELAQGLGTVLDSLAESDSSSSLVSTLSAVDEKITTTLKRHQREGIISILKREEGDYTASATNILKSVIGNTLTEIHKRVSGLSKSTTWRNCCRCYGPWEVLNDAECCVVFNAKCRRVLQHGAGAPNDKSNTHCRSVSAHVDYRNYHVLQLTPYSEVMRVWKSEVEKHIIPGAIRFCIFHGHNRVKMSEDIVDNDVVLTTYHTLVSDWKSRKLLQGIMWFRVVLDEAHWIRNTTSQQFKAAKSLTAQRRWWLSGTPIQNSLDDLRSLLDFLHFQPFSEPSFFRKHIVEQLNVRSLDPFRNLQLLLRIACFRRTAELLCLPSHETREIAIPLTETESQLYYGILDRCKEEIEDVSYMESHKKPCKKRCTVLFAATTRLRRLCNHGTFKGRQDPPGPQASKRQGKAAMRNKASKPSDEQMCAYCYGDNAEISADLGALEMCPECSRVLDQDAANLSRLNDGYGTPYTTSVSQPMSDLESCSPAQEGNFGFSSKLNAVVGNILNSPSSKHIVFTSWRLTLDVLQH
ncbi:uncharacterized protein PG986_011204 [Apiospora aurea]|uniref:Helicase ATP-binding domain-containing protein n=1 Tax=Apiospora aurea TaxID=335848 RepID=A0ABR1Q5Q7_9PEZI